MCRRTAETDAVSRVGAVSDSSKGALVVVVYGSNVRAACAVRCSVRVGFGRRNGLGDTGSPDGAGLRGSGPEVDGTGSISR